jgi:hypothetical protein
MMHTHHGFGSMHACYQLFYDTTLASNWHPSHPFHASQHAPGAVVGGVHVLVVDHGLVALAIRTPRAPVVGNTTLGGDACASDGNHALLVREEVRKPLGSVLVIWRIGEKAP